MKIVENKWFIVAVAGGCLFVFLSVLSGFIFKAYLQKEERQRQIEARQEAEREYEEKYRSARRRILENLRLDHYLAAYKNIEDLPAPNRADSLKVDEYLELLNRIGMGLIENKLLREAEGVFLTIRSYEGQVSQANEALGRIDSKRRIENAKFFFAQGQQLLAQNRYREAAQEFEKVQLELRSVEILKYDQVKEQQEALKAPLYKARFFTLIEDANQSLDKAEKHLKAKQFKQADQQISQGAIRLGRASFFNRDAPEIKVVRSRIDALDSELGYEIPNAVPIWNALRKEDGQKLGNYFELVGYELNPQLDEAGQMKIALEYRANPETKFFIVRYRIFFSNGHDFFNGHYLTSDVPIPSDQSRSVIYLQEIPEKFRKSQVKRIEVKVFDDQNQILSRVVRAFRVAS